MHDSVAAGFLQDERPAFLDKTGFETACSFYTKLLILGVNFGFDTTCLEKSGLSLYATFIHSVSNLGPMESC